MPSLRIRDSLYRHSRRETGVLEAEFQLFSCAAARTVAYSGPSRVDGLELATSATSTTPDQLPHVLDHQWVKSPRQLVRHVPSSMERRMARLTRIMAIADGFHGVFFDQFTTENTRSPRSPSDSRQQQTPGSSLSLSWTDGPATALPGVAAGSYTKLHHIPDQRAGMFCHEEAKQTRREPGHLDVHDACIPVSFAPSSNSQGLETAPRDGLEMPPRSRVRIQIRN
ncbi:hypothetical protein LZ30DRAFT_683973 [Colletotrichum cereale]|nr:hypothetical protein LZ30DRAFT_683973 [Colletotrichum cereale]